jgi:hypothetical protein
MAHGFHSNTTCSVSWNKCFYLNVYKSRSFFVTAGNINVGRVAKCDTGHGAPATKLAGYTKLAGVPAKCLIVFHD